MRKVQKTNKKAAKALLLIAERILTSSKQRHAISRRFVDVGSEASFSVSNGNDTSSENLEKPSGNK